MTRVFVAAIKRMSWRPSTHDDVQQLFPQHDSHGALIAWYRAEPEKIAIDAARDLTRYYYSDLLCTLYAEKLLAPHSTHMRDLDAADMDCVLEAAYRAGFPVDYEVQLAPLPVRAVALRYNLVLRLAWRLKKLAPSFEQIRHELPLLVDAYRHGLQPTDEHMAAFFAKYASPL